MEVNALKENGINFLSKSVLPMVGILVFIILWSLLAKNINTSLGAFPGPKAVYEQSISLYEEHIEERSKASKFYDMQEKNNAQRLAVDPNYDAKIRSYTGKKTYVDQIFTSLITVMCGFILSLLIGLPLGIAIGLNKGLNSALNPIIQILKPVSPLAWLPLVTMVVSATYTSTDPFFAKSFITSMITVTLCCLWPVLINTAVGVGSVENDLINVSRVINLSTMTHIRKIVLPSAIPLMFTGMRLSLGIAWMVLIAAEMLSQNPGLGKFVWDEFQNGSSNSLARIMVAVVTIGIIGFLLDRAMLKLQRIFSWQKIV
ncbi:MAG: ABC transporter permease [bacterium]|nr:ABC transporter permease [bacterium]